MNIPNDLQYSKSHEWLRLHDDGTAEIGLTDYAQQQLGQLVFVNLPEPGDPVTMGEAFTDVESVKAVSDVFSPVSATIVAINEELLDDPGTINADPYEAWLIRVEDITETEDLLDGAAYEAHCAEEAEEG